jgi:predicted GIY-YIG superfamily endonuclease
MGMGANNKNNMKTLELKNISNNDNVLLCAVIDRKDIGVKLKKVNGRIFNYILEFNKEIVYIGYSSNLYLRLVQHKGTKHFETITLIEFSNKQTARLMEKALIKKYKPIVNYQYLN